MKLVGCSTHYRRADQFQEEACWNQWKVTHSKLHQYVLAGHSGCCTSFMNSADSSISIFSFATCSIFGSLFLIFCFCSQNERLTKLLSYLSARHHVGDISYQGIMGLALVLIQTYRRYNAKFSENKKGGLLHNFLFLKYLDNFKWFSAYS